MLYIGGNCTNAILRRKVPYGIRTKNGYNAFFIYGCPKTSLGLNNPFVWLFSLNQMVLEPQNKHISKSVWLNIGLDPIYLARCPRLGLI